MTDYDRIYEWERQYRVAYWELNELQIIGELEATDEYRNLEWKLDNLVTWLGYTPEA